MRPFIFIHVPKCAGLSIRAALRAAALASGVPEGEIADHHTLTNPLPERIRHCQLVALHMDWEHFACAQFENPITFTMLRDPVDRAVSHYYYTLRHLNSDKQPRRFLTEEQIQLLQSYPGLMPMDECPAEILMAFLGYLQNAYMYFYTVSWEGTRKDIHERARARIEEFSVVGIMEDMEGTVRLLNEASPYSVPIVLPHINGGGNYPKPSKQLRELIEAEGVGVDRMVYEHAKALFEERVKEVAC